MEIQSKLSLSLSPLSLSLYVSSISLSLSLPLCLFSLSIYVSSLSLSPFSLISPIICSPYSHSTGTSRSEKPPSRKMLIFWGRNRLDSQKILFLIERKSASSYVYLSLFISSFLLSLSLSFSLSLLSLSNSPSPHSTYKPLHSHPLHIPHT